MKKKTGIIALILCIVLLFAGCNAGVISGETESAQNAQTQISQQISAKKKEAATQTKTTKKNNQSTTASKSNIKKSNKTTSKKSKSPLKKSNTSKPDSNRQTTRKTSNGKNTTKRQSNQTQNEKKKFGHCTITIQCREIFNNKSKLKEGHEKYLPDGGVFVKNFECSYREGETVFDIIKKVSTVKRLRLNVKETQYGLYIAGINNIDEFDVGKNSGWVYYVNGSFAKTSVNKYRVKNGDRIELRYTCGK